MKLPLAWQQAGSSSKPSAQKLTAKKALTAFAPFMLPQEHVGAPLDMSAEHAGQGLCPVTGEQMIRMRVGPHMAWVSPSDRIVLPIKDE